MERCDVRSGGPTPCTQTEKAQSSVRWYGKRCFQSNNFYTDAHRECFIWGVGRLFASEERRVPLNGRKDARAPTIGTSTFTPSQRGERRCARGVRVTFWFTAHAVTATATFSLSLLLVFADALLLFEVTTSSSTDIWRDDAILKLHARLTHRHTPSMFVR